MQHKAQDQVDLFLIIPVLLRHQQQAGHQIPDHRGDGKTDNRWRRCLDNFAFGLEMLGDGGYALHHLAENVLGKLLAQYRLEGDLLN
ncbi:hypothetical protein D3C81_2101480 [compost metagenome]